MKGSGSWMDVQNIVRVGLITVVSWKEWSISDGVKVLASHVFLGAWFGIS
jgi:hypothetical protein